jgi:hypothetical protein
MIIRHISVYVLVVAAIGGCRLLDFDSCLYELRGVQVEGTLSEAATEVMSVNIVVSEQRDYQPDKNMSWGFRSASLKGHVTSAVLRDASDETKILYQFPLQNLANDYFSSGFVRQSEGANLNGLFAVLSDGRGVVELRTDLPGKETVKYQPPRKYVQNWNRPKCG